MFQQKKPYTAVTVTLDNLTSESFDEEDLSGIPDLVDVIKLQASGPTEAARAIRKKLKYGNLHRQIRALVLLDGLIQNAGPHFQRTFADEPLLERLRVCGTSNLSDPLVRKKCSELFREWSQYATTPGLEKLSRLYKELPKRKVAATQERSKVVRETENPFGDDEEDAEEASSATRGHAVGSSPHQVRNASGPSQSSAWRPRHGRFGSSSSAVPGPADAAGKKSQGKSKEAKGRTLKLESEKEKIKSVIAESSMASTNLMNSLQSINREKERVSDNEMAVRHFEACKQLRRRTLRYIHLVEDEQWLGSLLHANDELVHALMAFEQLDQSIDADSDSDDELAEQAHLYRMATTNRAKDERATPDTAASGPPDFSALRLGSAAKEAAVRMPAKAASSSGAPSRPLGQAGNGSGDVSDDDYDSDDENPFGDRNVVDA